MENFQLLSIQNGLQLLEPSSSLSTGGPSLPRKGSLKAPLVYRTIPESSCPAFQGLVNKEAEGWLQHLAPRDLRQSAPSSTGPKIVPVGRSTSQPPEFSLRRCLHQAGLGEAALYLYRVTPTVLWPVPLLRIKRKVQEFLLKSGARGPPAWAEGTWV